MREMNPHTNTTAERGREGGEGGGINTRSNRRGSANSERRRFRSFWSGIRTLFRIPCCSANQTCLLLSLDDGSARYHPATATCVNIIMTWHRQF